MVTPGQIISGLAPARWRESQDGDGRELVLQATGPGEGKLLLWSGTTADRWRSFRTRRRAMWVLALSGGAAMLGGAVASVLAAVAANTN